MAVISSEESQKSLRKGLVKGFSRLATERNRWFVIALIMALISLVSVVFAIRAASEVQEVKVVWVKMYPDGTWNTEFYDQNREKEFFQSTINYLIRQWVIRRYSEIPVSIKNDYGFVYQFMSPVIQKEFLDKEGFDAAKKASDISTSTSGTLRKIKVRNISHYDSDKTNFGKYPGTLYRSNIFITQISFNSDGTKTGEEKLIVSLQWRIKSKKELMADDMFKKDSVGTLQSNPIGLEIIDYNIMNDSSK